MNSNKNNGRRIVNWLLVNKNTDISRVFIAATSFFITWIAFYPGFMSWDSLHQYAVSKSLIFDDWHPPVMSWLWSILNLFFRGPEGLLFFHLTLLWSGLYIWQLLYREKKFSWLILSMGFFPWIINFSGVLWKDVGMSFSLLLLFGIGFSKRTPAKILISAALLFYVISVRHNSIFAVVPILAIFAIRWFKFISKIKIFGLIISILFIFLVASNIFNYKICNASKTGPFNYIMVDDLFNLSLKKKNKFVACCVI